MNGNTRLFQGTGGEICFLRSQNEQQMQCGNTDFGATLFIPMTVSASGEPDKFYYHDIPSIFMTRGTMRLHTCTTMWKNESNGRLMELHFISNALK